VGEADVIEWVLLDPLFEGKGPVDEGYSLLETLQVEQPQRDQLHIRWPHLVERTLQKREKQQKKTK
jgi:hypothetical protein